MSERDQTVLRVRDLKKTLDETRDAYRKHLRAEEELNALACQVINRGGVFGERAWESIERDAQNPWYTVLP